MAFIIVHCVSNMKKLTILEQIPGDQWSYLFAQIKSFHYCCLTHTPLLQPM